MIKKNFDNTQQPEELTFWQSYSDMMAALLLMFVLIIAFYVTSLAKATEVYNVKITELDIKNKTISEYQAMLTEKEKELDKQKIQLKEQEEVLVSQQQQLDKLIGIRSELIKKLRTVFEATSMGVSVNSETGAISFDSEILFDLNKYELKELGRDFLNAFFPQYFKVILDEDLNAYIAEVMIEGHTDNTGQYLYNLNLSQRRAYSVAEYCLNDQSKMFDADSLDKIRKLVTANGRSFYDLKHTEEGEVDLAASRRVEIKFRLKEEEMIKEMAAILEKK